MTEERCYRTGEHADRMLTMTLIIPHADQCNHEGQRVSHAERCHAFLHEVSVL